MFSMGDDAGDALRKSGDAFRKSADTFRKSSSDTFRKSTQKWKPGGASSSTVSVVIRVRPPLTHEAKHDHCVIAEGQRIIVDATVPLEDLPGANANAKGGKRQSTSLPRSQTLECEYDNILDITHSQEDVWIALRDKAEKVLDGYNVTFITYGMTGSGKTYTMMGPELMAASLTQETSVPSHSLGTGRSLETLIKCPNRGLIARSAEMIFELLKSSERANDRVRIFVSYLQIYQEKIYDLLRPASGTSLKLREDAGIAGQVSTVYVEGLEEVPVMSVEDLFAKVLYGSRNRAFRSTMYNEQSSRSHVVLTFTVEQTMESGGMVRRSKMHLVDLAGNEKWDINGPAMSQAHTKELTQINKSLSALGNCVQALSQQAIGSGSSRGNPSHIPFRDSKLTLFLRDSLAGNAYTVMLCTICGCTSFQMQTISTLRFADRAKRLKMQARVNEAIDMSMLLKKYQREAAYLRSLIDVNGTEKLQTKVEHLEMENKILKQKLFNESSMHFNTTQEGNADKNSFRNSFRSSFFGRSLRQAAKLRRSYSEPDLLQRPESPGAASDDFELKAFHDHDNSTGGPVGNSSPERPRLLSTAPPRGTIPQQISLIGISKHEGVLATPEDLNSPKVLGGLTPKRLSSEHESPRSPKEPFRFSWGNSRSFSPKHFSSDRESLSVKEPFSWSNSKTEQENLSLKENLSSKEPFSWSNSKTEQENLSLKENLSSKEPFSWRNYKTGHDLNGLAQQLEEENHALRERLLHLQNAPVSPMRSSRLSRSRSVGVMSQSTPAALWPMEPSNASEPECEQEYRSRTLGSRVQSLRSWSNESKAVGASVYSKTCRPSVYKKTCRPKKHGTSPRGHRTAGHRDVASMKIPVRHAPKRGQSTRGCPETPLEERKRYQQLLEYYRNHACHNETGFCDDNDEVVTPLSPPEKMMIGQSEVMSVENSPARRNQLSHFPDQDAKNSTMHSTGTWNFAPSSASTVQPSLPIAQKRMSASDLREQTQLPWVQSPLRKPMVGAGRPERNGRRYKAAVKKSKSLFQPVLSDRRPDADEAIEPSFQFGGAVASTSLPQMTGLQMARPPQVPQLQTSALHSIRTEASSCGLSLPESAAIRGGGFVETSSRPDWSRTYRTPKVSEPVGLPSLQPPSLAQVEPVAPVQRARQIVPALSTFRGNQTSLNRLPLEPRSYPAHSDAGCIDPGFPTTVSLPPLHKPHQPSNRPQNASSGASDTPISLPVATRRPQQIEQQQFPFQPQQSQAQQRQHLQQQPLHSLRHQTADINNTDSNTLDSLGIAGKNEDQQWRLERELARKRKHEEWERELARKRKHEEWEHERNLEIERNRLRQECEAAKIDSEYHGQAAKLQLPIADVQYAMRDRIRDADSRLEALLGFGGAQSALQELSILEGQELSPISDYTHN